jgi:hypothetical protein
MSCAMLRNFLPSELSHLNLVSGKHPFLTVVNKMRFVNSQTGSFLQAELHEEDSKELQYTRYVLYVHREGHYIPKWLPFMEEGIKILKNELLINEMYILR